MNTNLRTLIAGTILGALSLGFAGVSNADEPLRVIVKFGDLDTSSAAGVQALYGRIQNAAVHVCSGAYYDQFAYQAHKAACLQQVIGGAVARVNQPALSAVFASKYVTSRSVVLAAVR